MNPRPLLAAATAAFLLAPVAGAADDDPLCGLHCLYVGVRVLGENVALADLRADLGEPEPGGYTLGQLAVAAEDRGLVARPVAAADCGWLRDRVGPFACVAHVDGGHFVLITGCTDEGTVRYVDPPHRGELPVATFARIYDGNALLLARSEAALADRPPGWLPRLGPAAARRGRCGATDRRRPVPPSPRRGRGAGVRSSARFAAAAAASLGAAGLGLAAWAWRSPAPPSPVSPVRPRRDGPARHRPADGGPGHDPGPPGAVRGAVHAAEPRGGAGRGAGPLAQLRLHGRRDLPRPSPAGGNGDADRDDPPGAGGGAGGDGGRPHRRRPRRVSSGWVGRRSPPARSTRRRWTSGPSAPGRR